MSVKKYRSVEEMAGPPTFAPLDPDNLQRLFEVIELAAFLHPFHFVPGVRKFRSIEEANHHRQARQLQQIRHRTDEDRR